MNYGQHGRDLLMELKRSEGNGLTEGVSLPAYNDKSVQSALQELTLHVQALNDQVESTRELSPDGKPPISVRPSILLQSAAIQRNKRCLLAYHQTRLDRIQQLYYWQSQEASEESMCPPEIEFLRDYEKLVQSFQASTGVSWDLRSQTVPPQPSDRVQVRVVNADKFDGGPIVLESGVSVVLTVGSTHYLLYSDVEEYLRSGDLELLPGEENI
jgi:GINS complex subunit 1